MTNGTPANGLFCYNRERIKMIYQQNKQLFIWDYLQEKWQ